MSSINFDLALQEIVTHQIKADGGLENYAQILGALHLTMAKLMFSLSAGVLDDEEKVRLNYEEDCLKAYEAMLGMLDGLMERKDRYDQAK